nr:MAG TPA: hypothetical protein [Siphoviridae sp. ct7Ev5]DAO21038.1 MAG TPA: hypothetical protein [Caudoviricetes sp.]
MIITSLFVTIKLLSIYLVLQHFYIAMYLRCPVIT